MSENVAEPSFLAVIRFKASTMPFTSSSNASRMSSGWLRKHPSFRNLRLWTCRLTRSCAASHPSDSGESTHTSLTTIVSISSNCSTARTSFGRSQQNCHMTSASGQCSIGHVLSTHFSSMRMTDRRRGSSSSTRRTSKAGGNARRMNMAQGRFASRTRTVKTSSPSR